MSQRVLTFPSFTPRSSVGAGEGLSLVEAHTFRARALDVIADRFERAVEGHSSVVRARYTTRGLPTRDGWSSVAQMLVFASHPSDQRLAARIGREKLADAFASRPAHGYDTTEDLVDAVDAALLTVGVRTTEEGSALTRQALHEIDVPSEMAIVTLTELLEERAMDHVVFQYVREGELVWLSRIGSCAEERDSED